MVAAVNGGSLEVSDDPLHLSDVCEAMQDPIRDY